VKVVAFQNVNSVPSGDAIGGRMHWAAKQEQAQDRRDRFHEGIARLTTSARTDPAKLQSPQV
jgi:hypothetical protein